MFDYAEDMAARATEGKRRISVSEWRERCAREVEEHEHAATGDGDGEF